MTNTLTRIRKRLRAHRGQYRALAKATGLSYSSLCKLAQGHHRNPSLARVERITALLDKFEAGRPVAQKRRA